MKLEVAVVVAVLAGVGFIGYHEGFEAASRAHAHAREEAVARATADMQARAEQNAEVVSEYVKKVQTLEARNRSLASTARSLSERLRGAGVPAGDASACGPCAERLAGCRRLLGEGGELLAEGAGLAERIAARKDALTGLK